MFFGKGTLRLRHRLEKLANQRRYARRPISIASRSVPATTMCRFIPMNGMRPGSRPSLAQCARYESVIARTAAAGRLVTTFTPVLAAHSVLSALNTPYHSGGCGFFTRSQMERTASELLESAPEAKASQAHGLHTDLVGAQVNDR